MHKSSWFGIPFRELIKYGFVGLATNAAGYVVFLLVTHFGVKPRYAMTVLYAIFATIGFFANRQWTFSHSGGLLGTGIRYVISQLSGYMINYLMLLILAEKLGYPYQGIQAAAIFVVAGFLFLAFKYFVFAKPPESLRDSQ
jgi:putative flippase GtrA